MVEKILRPLECKLGMNGQKSQEYIITLDKRRRLLSYHTRLRLKIESNN